MSLISLDNVKKNYVNGADCVIALNGLDLNVSEGTFLGVMGPSGSGKSTLLSVLGGLTSPSTGTVSIDNIDVYSLTAEKLADFRREYLGFILPVSSIEMSSTKSCSRAPGVPPASDQIRTVTESPTFALWAYE